MNLREGGRRLALFVGVIGAITGSVYSCILAIDAINQHGHYKEFSRLAALPVVRENDDFRKLLHRKLPDRPLSDDSIVDQDGVHRIVWGSDGRIEWIEPTGGGTVFAQTEGVSFWQICAILALPVLGFLIPCLVVRSILWVILGFTRLDSSG